MAEYAIVTPIEFKCLLGAVPKLKHRMALDTLCHTGLRYNEYRLLAEHPEWFSAKNREIVLPAKATKTKRDRNIPLTPAFSQKLELWLSSNKLSAPSMQGMDKNLQRWCEVAGIKRISVKTFRKTWLTYLLMSMPEKADLIYASMGHSREISARHYLIMTGTLKNEIEAVKEAVRGWNT